MEQNIGYGRLVAGKKCLNCGLPRKKKKFCTLKCYWESKTGEKHNWGFKISKALTGKQKSAIHIEKVRQALLGRKRPDIAGKNNWQWKGDDVGYDALHDWVRAKKGNPSHCKKCGIKAKKSRGRWSIHWANKSKKYKRNLNDWIALCRKCHYQYDIK